jgi:hypothetical protein
MTKKININNVITNLKNININNNIITDLKNNTCFFKNDFIKPNTYCYIDELSLIYSKPKKITTINNNLFKFISLYHFAYLGFGNRIEIIYDLTNKQYKLLYSENSHEYCSVICNNDNINNLLNKMKELEKNNIFPFNIDFF